MLHLEKEFAVATFCPPSSLFTLPVPVMVNCLLLGIKIK